MLCAFGCAVCSQVTLQTVWGGCNLIYNQLYCLPIKFTIDCLKRLWFFMNFIQTVNFYTRSTCRVNFVISKPAYPFQPVHTYLKISRACCIQCTKISSCRMCRHSKYSRDKSHIACVTEKYYGSIQNMNITDCLRRL
jgi:hypothetical protein